jgi:DNA-binding XRE family transcriptional regulator
MSILKEEDILEIRKLSSLYTKMQLAEMFGVGRRSINNIVT